MNNSIEQIERAMEALYSTDAEDRVEAITLLGEVEHQPAVEHLVKIVEDVDPGTRYIIVQALGRIASEDSIPTLLRAMRWDDIFTRAAATGALIQIGEATLDGLVEGLRDENKAVRRAAAKAIGKIGIATENAVMGLSAALLDIDSGVRRFAAEALGRLGNERIVPELVEVLDDRDPKARIAAFRALAKIDSAEARQAVRAWVKR